MSSERIEIKSDDAVRIGNDPKYRFVGLSLGVILAFAALGAGIAQYSKGTMTFAVLSFAVLAASFKSNGATLRGDGIDLWSYTFWLFGYTKFVRAQDIHSFALGDKDGKFTLIVTAKDHSPITLSVTWASVKDAQIILDIAQKRYGTAVELAVKDPGLIDEAARVSRATRFAVVPRKKSRADGERLLFADADGNRMGEIRLLMGSFQGGKGEIADGPGDLASNAPRWKLKAGLDVLVTEGDSEPIVVEFTGRVASTEKKLVWTDNSKRRWTALYSTDSEYATAFEFRFYRGEPDSANLVGIASGEPGAFAVDVVAPDGWPWIRIALGCLWMRFRPNFIAVKE